MTPLPTATPPPPHVIYVLAALSGHHPTTVRRAYLRGGAGRSWSDIVRAAEALGVAPPWVPPY